MSTQEIHNRLLEKDHGTNTFQGSLNSQDNNDSDPNIYRNYTEYLFSVIGVAVGFGSFWRFPYLVYKNGGGAFLIPYFIAVVFLGIPLLYLQTVVGQFYRSSEPFIFSRINQGLKYLGYTFIFISFTSSYYYNLILAYSYRYLLTAFQFQLPYSKQAPLDTTYFHEEFLHRSKSIEEWGNVNYSILALYAFSMFVCFYIVKNGVKTSGRISVFTAIVPYVFFVILMLRGLFLEGAFQGLDYLFVPKMEKLLSVGIWVDAFVQVFYQITIGCGIAVNFSSMKKRNQQFLSGMLIVPLSFIVCGLLCAMIVFMYLGHFCLLQNINLEDTTMSGPELSFNIFPKALSILPYANLWVFCFFGAMVFLGIDTQFGFLECIYCCLKDELKEKGGSIKMFSLQLSQKGMKYGCILVQIILSWPLASCAGIYLLEYLDYFINSVPLSIGALVQVYVFVYLVPYQQLENQIIKYRKQSTPKWIRQLLEGRFILGLLWANLLFALIDQINFSHQYSFKYSLFGWFLTVYGYIWAYFYYRIYKSDHWNLTFESMEKQRFHQRKSLTNYQNLPTQNQMYSIKTLAK